MRRSHPKDESGYLLQQEQFLYLLMSDPTLVSPARRSASHRRLGMQGRQQTNIGNVSRKYELTLLSAGLLFILVMVFSGNSSSPVDAQPTTERPRALVTLTSPPASFWLSMQPTKPLPKPRPKTSVTSDSENLQLDNDYLIQPRGSALELQQHLSDESSNP